MTDDAAFLAAIAADPTDNLVRLVYADWLDERGDPRGAYLRAECDFAAIADPTNTQRAELRSRAAKLAPDWLAGAARVPIESCRHLTFEFECPKRWELLPATDEADVRFCHACSRSVYFCDSVAKALHVASAGECVAVHAALTRRPGDLAPPDSSTQALHLLAGVIRMPEPPPPRVPPFRALRQTMAGLFGGSRHKTAKPEPRPPAAARLLCGRPHRSRTFPAQGC